MREDADLDSVLGQLSDLAGPRDIRVKRWVTPSTMKVMQALGSEKFYPDECDPDENNKYIPWHIRRWVLVPAISNKSVFQLNQLLRTELTFKNFDSSSHATLYSRDRFTLRRVGGLHVIWEDIEGAVVRRE